MKRLILITITAITLCNSVLAQQRLNVDSLKSQIAKRDTLINTLRSKNRLIDSLKQQIEDYKRLLEGYDELISEKNSRNDTLESENSRYKNVLASDTSVFFNIPEINENVPVCLKKHISLIQKIGELADKIKSLEDKITDIQNNSPYATDAEKKTTIKREIESDLNIIDELFNEVANLDMSTLSEEQKKFYDPGLTERYNKFLIYFE